MRPIPPQVLLLGSIASVQFGAAFANKLFAQAGPGGVVFLRLALSAVLLLAVVRPTVRGRTRADLGAVLGYGLILGTMNWSFYEALAPPADRRRRDHRVRGPARRCDRWVAARRSTWSGWRWQAAASRSWRYAVTTVTSMRSACCSR